MELCEAVFYEGFVSGGRRQHTVYLAENLIMTMMVAKKQAYVDLRLLLRRMGGCKAVIITHDRQIATDSLTAMRWFDRVYENLFEPAAKV